MPRLVYDDYFFIHLPGRLNYCQITIINSQNSRRPEEQEGESSDDPALFFPKALNAWFCLAGLLTCPGF
jgi:hypothetical protein